MDIRYTILQAWSNPLHVSQDNSKMNWDVEMLALTTSTQQGNHKPNNAYWLQSILARSTLATSYVKGLAYINKQVDRWGSYAGIVWLRDLSYLDIWECCASNTTCAEDASLLPHQSILTYVAIGGELIGRVPKFSNGASVYCTWPLSVVLIKNTATIWWPRPDFTQFWNSVSE